MSKSETIEAIAEVLYEQYTGTCGTESAEECKNTQGASLAIYDAIASGSIAGVCLAEERDLALARGDSAIGRYADMMRERDALRALLILAAKHMMCDRACLEGRGCVCGGKEAWNKIQDAITPPTSTTPDAKETK